MVDRYLTDVLQDKEYEPALRDLVVIDAGCNIGTFSLSVYAQAQTIYAIDPSEENIGYLRSTISENNLTKIQTFCTALSGEGGSQPFVLDDNPGLGGWHIGSQGTDLPTVTIEQFLNDNNIPVVDLLKIDVEGAEKGIFQSESFKRVASRIHKIVGEFHQYDPKEDLEKAGYLYTTYQTKQGDIRFIAKKL